jgi:diguanylate cyclase (GGDEF)-like protein/PAS domain S-box-containing protein
MAGDTSIDREDGHAHVVRGADESRWEWDLALDRLCFSPQFEAMLGCGPRSLAGRSSVWLGRVHPRDLPGLKARLAAHLEGRSERFECEYRVAHADGRYLWVLGRAVASRDARGKAVRLAGSQTDVTRRKAFEERILHDALHDPLTGLPNRAAFVERLTMLINQSERHPDHGFAVLFLDLDRFKTVNDSVGHAIGDELLVAFARRLEACLRHGDTVARLGGDEFALLLDGTGSVKEATRAAERVHQALKSAFHLTGCEVFSSASIGIALSSTGYEKPEDMMRDADTAMYRAKALGRSCHAVFDQAMHARAVELLRLETDLRRAVERCEFLLHYQPVVSLAEGRVASLEGLVRWRHPANGLVMPNDFIPLAEDTGLIVPLGDWVLREACRQMRQWGEGKGPAVSINLSARQLAQPGLVESVRAALAATGLEPGRLGVEITESVLMEGGEIRERLRELRGLGARLMLDDFGTGYSSLSYLLRFPIDVLKIDASFVQGLELDPEKRAIVRSIVSVGRNLGKEIVAEGVENAEQAELLREIGCDYGQGFYWARPVDADAVRAMI